MLKKILLTLAVLAMPHFSVANEDILYFEEDGRVWLYAGKTKVGEKTYVPENQDPENWNEAIILHHINAENVPLEVYYESFMNILNEKSGNIFRSSVLDHTDDYLIFEWWIDPNTEGAQHGLIKVSKTPLGLQFFRYTTKVTENMDELKSNWVNILKGHDFSVVPQKVKVDVDFTLDGRDWDLADSSNTNQEFILRGETLDQWTEKFSIDVFTLQGMSPFAFYYKMIHDLEDKTGKDVETKVIDSGMNHIVFEWKINDDAEPQWSFYKMTVLDSKLASGMQYSSKFDDADTDAKNVWEEIMRKAKANISYDYLLKGNLKNTANSQNEKLE